MSGMMPVLDNYSFEPGKYDSSNGTTSDLTENEVKFLFGAVAGPPLAAIALGLGSGVIPLIRGTLAYRALGVVKRPMLSFGVYNEIAYATEFMFISKTYAKIMLAFGIYDINKNIALAREKEYKRLGINLMGPPGSLWLYDNYMQKDKLIDDLEVIEQESRRDPSLTSGSQTRGKSNSYKPKAGHKCAKGYRKINGMCVKQ